MKMVLALIQPYKLEAVMRTLLHIPHLRGMTVTDARGFGREKVEVTPTSNEERLTDFTRTTRIELVLHDEQVSAVIDAIVGAVHTGQRGDGKIFVLPVEHAVRIKTRMEGDDAV